MTEPEATFCAAHPKVETYLRCGRCNTPICPRCLIQTPVGARCRACARLRKLPMYDVSPRFLLRGAAAGLLAATLGGFVVLFVLGSLRFFGIFGLLAFGALYGYGVSEVVSRVTNRKRGASLVFATVMVLIIGFVISRCALIYTQLGGLPEPARLAQTLALGFNPDLGQLAFLAVAGLIAYNRLR